jgi:EAL domain-containing protein (putative c-di-GMP-specific phosphodiesterase class I)
MGLFHLKLIGRHRLIIMKLPDIGSLMTFKSGSIAAKLKTAIENDEICLNYFPVINAKTGHTVEVEALLRWPTAKDTYIPPLEFIPVAEANGLMPVLTRWVINTAISQLSEWLKMGIDIGMTINLSIIDLEDQSLVDFIEQQLKKHQIPPEYLGFEIPEVGVVSISKDGELWLKKLHALGVRMILDNLSNNCRNFVFENEPLWSMIKIHWHLVMQMTNVIKTRSEVNQIISKALKQGVTVIVPGIHSYEEWDCISKKQSILAQGFYFSSPQYQSELDLWFRLSNWKPKLMSSQITTSDNYPLQQTGNNI